MNNNLISLEEMIDYEIAGSLWSGFVPRWLEKIAGDYFTWKTSGSTIDMLRR